MSACCSVCNNYPCPGCLGAAYAEIDRLKKQVENLDRIGHMDLGWGDIAEAAGLDRDDWSWDQLRDAVCDLHFEKSGAMAERKRIVDYIRHMAADDASFPTVIRAVAESIEKGKAERFAVDGSSRAKR
jgi:hypothetical protein